MSIQPIIKNINIPDPESEVKKSFGEKLYSSFKSNPIPYLQGTGYAADALLSYNKEVSQDMDYEDAMRDRFQQKPIFDYNYMYGPGTNGGSQFQPVIKAEDGTLVRKGSSPALPIEIEGGEILQLPDGTIEKAKGPKHKDGGISTLLPQGTKVFSNKLKPTGSDKTFAQLANKHDYTKEKEVLNNFYSHDTSKKAAELMMGRKVKALDDLFAEQQVLNGESEGEPEALAKGGWIQKAVNPAHKGYCTPMTKSTCTPHRKALAMTFKKHHGFHEEGGYVFEEGGEYDLAQEEIDQLIKQGYKIEYVK